LLRQCLLAAIARAAGTARLGEWPRTQPLEILPDRYSLRKACDEEWRKSLACRPIAPPLSPNTIREQSEPGAAKGCRPIGPPCNFLQYCDEKETRTWPKILALATGCSGLSKREVRCLAHARRQTGPATGILRARVGIRLPEPYRAPQSPGKPINGRSGLRLAGESRSPAACSWLAFLA
jgi:hypothetical protein